MAGSTWWIEGAGQWTWASVLLFYAFACFTVFICQRLVEQAALALEPMERKAAFARSATCIGCMVWALDAAGQFIYPDMVARDPHLGPAILGLLVMAGGTLVSVPAITHTRRRGEIALAGLVMSFGMIFGHVLLFSAFGELTGVVHWRDVSLAITLASGLAIVLSLRHRSARLRALHGGFRRLTWPEYLLGGGVVLLIHRALSSSLELEPVPANGNDGQVLLLLLALVVFGVLVAAAQMHSMGVEKARRRLLDQALARLRTLPDEAGLAEGQQLSLIAERLPDFLVPGQLRLHFQPIVPVSQQFEAIRFEALLRVEAPELGRINPEMFFLACARAGRQAEADRLVIAQALEISQHWTQYASRCAGISVNVAPETLDESDFVSWLKLTLDRYALPPEWLKLEITEHSMIATTERIVDVLLDLHDIGVGVILDDFGTGFSSLGVITLLPIEGVKIDRSLIRNLERNRANQLLLKHLSALARDIGMTVTVEGVETLIDLSIARRKGVDGVQGYVFARAMAPEMVPDWLGKLSLEHSGDGAIRIPRLLGWERG